jgi:hypothetical protein
MPFELEEPLNVTGAWKINLEIMVQLTDEMLLIILLSLKIQVWLIFTPMWYKIFFTQLWYKILN